jgi:hypothetical protein
MISNVVQKKQTDTTHFFLIKEEEEEERASCHLGCVEGQTKSAGASSEKEKSQLFTKL